MAFKVKKAVAALAAVCMLALTSCYDLGSFADIDDYYDSFSDATFYDKSFNSDSYSIEDYLYNEDTQNDYNKSDNDITFMDSGDYSYMWLECKRDMTIRSIAFFVNADVSDALYYEIYQADSFDTADFSSYDAEEKATGDLTSPINDSSVICINDDWSYTEINCTNEFQDGDYIIIKFVNNTFDGKKNNYATINFKIVNFLVCADF